MYTILALFFFLLNIQSMYTETHEALSPEVFLLEKF